MSLAALVALSLGCPKGDPCGDLIRDPETESCVCPDGFTPRPDLGICEGPDGSIIPYDAGPLTDAAPDAPDMLDSGFDTGVDAGIDSGLDGGTDACTQRTFYRDMDRDSFGDPDFVQSACEAPDGYAGNDDDCDDDCSSCQPGGTEVCDGRDNDCDGVEDDGVLTTFFRDMDGDSFGNPTMSVQGCMAPAGFVSNDDDCNDDCNVCRPGGTEVCEGTLDENCAMGVDEGCACTNGTTRACPGGTTVGACVTGTQTCASGVWGACMGAVGPTAETCDGVDNDCDTIPDNGAAAVSCGSVARATDVGCSGGSCFVSSCASGFRDCDAAFANGCEAQLGTVATCLSCGDACGWDCEAAGCNDAAAIYTGGSTACVVRESGQTVCWGDSEFGEVGDGFSVDRVEPVPILDSTRLVSLKSDHACAVMTNGSVRCWGRNNRGQLGNGTTTGSATPVTVSGLSSVVDIGVGSDFSCALRDNGTVYCWGGNDIGQLGDGTIVAKDEPVMVSTLFNVTDIAVGTAFACAVREGGDVWCWGSNSFLSLGATGLTSSRTPVQATSIVDAETISAHGGHVCVVTRSGGVQCWGRNNRGQLGNGSTMDSAAASNPLTSGIEQVACGENHTCVRATDGAVRCWGGNASGQLGVVAGADVRTPPATPLAGLAAVSVSTSFEGTCVVLSSGSPMCWGRNTDGQLGDGTTMSRSMPMAVRAP